MPNCSSNSVMLTRPPLSAQQAAMCGPGCGGTGAADCLDANKLGPRRKREAVIEQIKDYVLLMLGAPTVDVELDDQALDLAVKQTLKVMEYYAPREFFTYYTFHAYPGQSVYEMPPDVGFIRHVAYRETAEYAFTSADLQGSIPIEYFYPGGAYSSIQGGLIDPIQPIWGQSGPWNIYKMYERMYTRMSSGLGGWEWVNGYKFLKLYPCPYRNYHVIVHYIQKCKDWEEVVLPMQEGALAHAQMILGTIRKKYGNIPGPSGGIQLDGAEMFQTGKENYEKWRDELLTRWGDLPAITLG